ncbi:MAG: glycosyltransferase family 39 protein [bacterium]|nr:glycosyltransferase family 39 protein [bacterium]
MPTPTSRSLAIGLFFLALVFHTSVVWQDFSILAQNGFLYDDSFYAFKIAQNIANGQGVTFDGTHATNGFQPLYVLILVPVFWLSGSNLVAPVYVALTLSALLTALTALFLFAIVRRYTGKTTAAIVTFFWAMSPVVTRQAANGLETSLALFFFAASVYFYLTRIRCADSPSRGAFIRMGLLVGLAALARIDELILGLVILLDYLLLVRRRQTRAFGNVFAAIAVAIVVYSPWLAYNVKVTGSPYQESGTATRYLSLAYAPFYEIDTGEAVRGEPNAAFLWRNVRHSFSVLKLAPPVHPAFRSIERADMALGSAGVVERIGSGVGLLVLAGFLFVVLKRRRWLPAGIVEVRFLLWFCALLVASYSLVVFGAFFFIRYYYPIYFVLCIYAAFFVEAALRRLPAFTPTFRKLAIGAVALYGAALLSMAYTSAYRSTAVYPFYDVARWVDEHTAPHETIGVFQGGAVGYLSHRRVINLDGKVNGGALDALRSDRLSEYLADEGIDVLMDNAKVLKLFIGTEELERGLRVHYNPIMHGSQGGVPGWAAYRLVPDRSTTGATLSSPQNPSGNR